MYGGVVCCTFYECVQHTASNLAATAAEHPTAAELQWVRNNHDDDHEGMNDQEVEHAMTTNSDCLNSMMFVNTVVTDDNGNPEKDPESGKVVTEEDGCD